MTRPFSIIGFTYLFALLLASNFNYNNSILIAIALIILFSISLCVKNFRITKIIPTVILTISVAFFVYGISNFQKIEPIKKLDNVDTKISGTICDLPYEFNNRFYYIIKTDKFKTRISTDVPIESDVCDKVTCNVHLFLPKNNSFFSQKNHYISKGIYILGYTTDENIEIQKNTNHNMYYYALKFRESLTKSIRILLPNELSSIANGMLVGDKSNINETIKSDFKDLGISHLLAVSGLHVSVIAQIFIIICTTLKLNKKVSALLSASGVFLFMAITGFSPSVIRAGIMLIIYLISIFFRRESDSLNSLGLAVFIILLLNPFAAGDLGLLLSFSATLGILLFSKKIQNKIKLPDKLSSSIALTISATIATFPIIALSFKRISIISIIANLAIVVPSLFMMPLILFSSLLYLINPLKFIANILAFLAGLLIKYIIWCSEILSKFPFTSISISNLFVVFWLISSLILISIAIIISKKKSLYKIKILSLLSIIILFTGILSNQLANINTISLAVLDSGNGMSIVITKNHNAAILSCGGDKFKSNVIQNYLNSKNIKNIDYLAITNFEDSSCLYADNIIQTYDPDFVLLKNDKKINDKITTSNLSENSLYYFDKNVKTYLWESINLNLISQKSKSFIKLNINNLNILITPSGGDLENISNEFCNCDILITSKILKKQNKTNSKYCILSSDQKNFDKISKNLVKYNNIIYNTANNGDIILDFIENDQISIKKNL